LVILLKPKKKNRYIMVDADLSKAIAALKNGEVVVYPTDTLYALGADVFNLDAVRKVFEVKNRSLDKALSVAVSCLDDVERIAFVDDVVRSLVDRFLPGPLTLVLNKKDVVSNVVTGGFEKVAVRIPGNEFALELLSSFGPLTVTSANVSGLDAHDILDIKKQFSNDDVAVYLDVGRLDGVPSTIVDVTNKEPVIIRKGIITLDEILEVI